MQIKSIFTTIKTLTTASILIASCAHNNQIDAKDEFDHHKPEQRKDDTEDDILLLDRRYWSDRLCKLDHHDAIVDFMEKMEKYNPEVCTPDMLENALKSLKSAKKMIAYVEPGSALPLPRRGEAKEFYRDFHSSTRILYLYQPYDDTPEAIRQSESSTLSEMREIIKVAESTGYIQLLDQQNESETIILPSTYKSNIHWKYLHQSRPYPLPCKFQKESELRSAWGPSAYNELMQNRFGEPGKDKKRIRIWIIRSDCR